MPQTALSELGPDYMAHLSDGEPDWLQKRRIESLSIYDTMPLEVSPLYTKYTDAAKMDSAKVMLADGKEQIVPDFLQKRLAELKDQICIVQIGNMIQHIGIPEKYGASGLEVIPVKEAVLKEPEIVQRSLESAPSDEDRFTALNNAAFGSGIFIRVPKNLELESPIHVVSCLPSDGTSVISRNIIHAGEASRASIVQELYSPLHSGQQAYLEVLSVDAASGSHLDLTSLQMMADTAVNFSTRRARISQDATVNWYLGLFGAMLSRYRIDYDLNGSGAQANDSEVAFGSGDQSFDIQSNVTHASPATEARIIEKSILRDRSKSLFKGMIRIMENATKSNSYLSGRSILLDKDAKSEAIPGLEIHTNDVKATHSASVAQIDEEQIFYMLSRCLERAQAERTIVEGFLEPLSRKMSYQVRAWIAYLVESKWEGRELSINTDAELRRFVEVEETRYNEDEEIEQHYKYR